MEPDLEMLKSMINFLKGPVKYILLVILAVYLIFQLTFAISTKTSVDKLGDAYTTMGDACNTGDIKQIEKAVEKFKSFQ